MGTMPEVTRGGGGGLLKKKSLVHPLTERSKLVFWNVFSGISLFSLWSTIFLLRF